MNNAENDEEISTEIRDLECEEHLDVAKLLEVRLKGGIPPQA